MPSSPTTAREEPTVGASSGARPSDALRWALQLAPGDSALRAKQVECEAHVARIAAQATAARQRASAGSCSQAAIAKFQRAAELDPASFDPYLGISRTQVYGFDDVEAAAAAIAEAEKRGYHSSRREQAQLGDGFLRRAEKSRRLARTLSGDQRRRELENAHAAYAPLRRAVRSDRRVRQRGAQPGVLQAAPRPGLRTISRLSPWWGTDMRVVAPATAFARRPHRSGQPPCAHRDARPAGRRRSSSSSG